MKPQDGAVRPWEFALQRLLWSALVLVLVGVGFAGTWSLLRGGLAGRLPGAGASPSLPTYGSVPDFSLTERSGRQVGGSELRGKVWIANFIYTHCPDTCPLQSAQMARLQGELAAEGDVRLVSITVDPERDTLEVLSRYADRFGAAPDRWLFLTGEKGLRGLVRWSFEPAVALAHPGHTVQLVLHSSRFVLVDRLSRIRGYYDSADGESLRRLPQHVRALLGET
ncbi:MAG: SCO family protein [candidate division NC10 bacterium]|nr:SCO family protein [candidate division NC10 bacterium]